jgi:hypothetical protein
MVFHLKLTSFAAERYETVTYGQTGFITRFTVCASLEGLDIHRTLFFYHTTIMVSKANEVLIHSKVPKPKYSLITLTTSVDSFDE